MVGTTPVSWKVTEGNHLEAVIFEFTGCDIRYSETGAILPTYPELEKKAYRVANYLADRIFVQTGFDAIDPNHLFSEPPTISPENESEEVEFKTKKKSLQKEFQYSWSMEGLFEPSPYAHGFNNSRAHGYYADAMRVASPFQKFELLYKVVEYFFPNKDGTDLDVAVLAHVIQHDVNYKSDVFEQLRVLRSKIVHPHAKKVHVNPQNIADVRDLRLKLDQMRTLVDLLLAHPTNVGHEK